MFESRLGAERDRPRHTTRSLSAGRLSLYPKPAARLWAQQEIAGAATLERGLRVRPIGRLLAVSNVTVLNWMRRIGQEVQPCVASPSLALKAEEITMVERDEWWPFVGQKTERSGYGLLWSITPEPSSLIVLAAEAARLPRASGQL